MKRVTSVLLACAAFGILACQSQDAPPTRLEISSAMQALYNGPIDQITDLNCRHAGHSKYLCDYTVSVIGMFPEKRSDCMFASATGWVPVDAIRCE